MPHFVDPTEPWRNANLNLPLALTDAQRPIVETSLAEYISKYRDLKKYAESLIAQLNINLFRIQEALLSPTLTEDERTALRDHMREIWRQVSTLARQLQLHMYRVIQSRRLLRCLNDGANLHQFLRNNLGDFPYPGKHCIINVFIIFMY